MARSSAGPLSAPGPGYCHRFPAPGTEFQPHEDSKMARLSSAGPLSAPGPSCSHRFPAPGTEFQPHEDSRCGQVVFCRPSQCSWFRLQPWASRARYRISATRGLEIRPGLLLVALSVLLVPATAIGFPRQVQNFSHTRTQKWPGCLLLAL
jgi:hypothetical protein